MSQKSDAVIVQNDTAVNMTLAVVVMSVNLNGTNARDIAPRYLDQEVSTANPLPPNQQASLDISTLNRQYKYARFRHRFAGGQELQSGPYTTPGNGRFIQQVRLAARRADGRYIQVQIEDQRSFNDQAIGDGKEFDDSPAAEGSP